MDFTTKVDIPESPFKIDHTQSLFFTGSCFAQNISQKFKDLKFKTLVNPFGVIYNPLSISRMLENIESGKQYTLQDLFCDNGLWSNWDAHSSLSNSDKDLCLQNLNEAISRSQNFLKNADTAFITLGTAFVYFMKLGGMVVSNCHRQDPALFGRERVSIEEAAQALEKAVHSLRQINPNIKIVFTVSPLRHMSDGAHENNLSKFTLHLAVDEIVKKYPQFTSYFPSYEIVMDELRDYRFYASDMVHLSETAEQYIFEKMGDAYFDETTKANIKLLQKFLKSANHRIVDENSPKNKAFAEKHLALALDLMKLIPGLDLSEEQKHLKKYCCTKV